MHHAGKKGAASIAVVALAIIIGILAVMFVTERSIRAQLVPYNQITGGSTAASMAE